MSLCENVKSVINVTSLDAQLGPAPVSPLDVVTDRAAGPQTDPVGDRLVLLLLDGQRPLRAERLLRRLRQSAGRWRKGGEGGRSGGRIGGVLEKNGSNGGSQRRRGGRRAESLDVLDLPKSIAATSSKASSRRSGKGTPSRAPCGQPLMLSSFTCPPVVVFAARSPAAFRPLSAANSTATTRQGGRGAAYHSSSLDFWAAKKNRRIPWDFELDWLHNEKRGSLCLPLPPCPFHNQPQRCRTLTA